MPENTRYSECTAVIVEMRPMRSRWTENGRAGTGYLDVWSTRPVVLMRTFPRRQQTRRLRRAAASGAAAIVAGALAATAAGAGATALAGSLALVMAALVVDARRWVRLAARSRVGAQSEAQVRRALSGLKAEGWQLRHSLLWAGRGDMDSVAIAPTGVAFARSKRASSTHATWPAPARRPCGFTGIGGAGAVEERSRCCAWCAPAGSST